MFNICLIYVYHMFDICLLYVVIYVILTQVDICMVETPSGGPGESIAFKFS